MSHRKKINGTLQLIAGRDPATIIDSQLDANSENPVQNKVVTGAINQINTSLTDNVVPITLPSDWHGVCDVHKFGNFAFLQFNAYCENVLNDGGSYPLASVPDGYQTAISSSIASYNATAETVFFTIESGILTANIHKGAVPANSYLVGSTILVK